MLESIPYNPVMREATEEDVERELCGVIYDRYCNRYGLLKKTSQSVIDRMFDGFLQNCDDDFIS